MQTKNCVLDSRAVNRKIKRIALEIAEQNFSESNLVIAGIVGNGEVVARLLVKELETLSDFEMELATLVLNKKAPFDARLQNEPGLDNKVVILVDDVANTGRTMLYAMKPLLNARPKKIQTVVLVERSHKLFPVQTDYTGLSITTTLQEHISVETAGYEITGAFLS